MVIVSLVLQEEGKGTHERTGLNKPVEDYTLKSPVQHTMQQSRTNSTVGRTSPLIPTLKKDETKVVDLPFYSLFVRVLTHDLCQIHAHEFKQNTPITLRNIYCEFGFSEYLVRKPGSRTLEPLKNCWTSLLTEQTNKEKEFVLIDDLPQDKFVCCICKRHIMKQNAINQADILPDGRIFHTTLDCESACWSVLLRTEEIKEDFESKTKTTSQIWTRQAQILLNRLIAGEGNIFVKLGLLNIIFHKFTTTRTDRTELFEYAWDVFYSKSMWWRSQPYDKSLWLSGLLIGWLSFNFSLPSCIDTNTCLEFVRTGAIQRQDILAPGFIFILLSRVADGSSPSQILISLIEGKKLSWQTLEGCAVFVLLVQRILLKEQWTEKWFNYLAQTFLVTSCTCLPKSPCDSCVSRVLFWLVTIICTLYVEHDSVWLERLIDLPTNMPSHPNDVLEILTWIHTSHSRHVSLLQQQAISKTVFGTTSLQNAVLQQMISIVELLKTNLFLHILTIYQRKFKVCAVTLIRRLWHNICPSLDRLASDRLAKDPDNLLVQALLSIESEENINEDLVSFAAFACPSVVFQWCRKLGRQKISNETLTEAIRCYFLHVWNVSELGNIYKMHQADIAEKKRKEYEKQLQVEDAKAERPSEIFINEWSHKLKCSAIQFEIFLNHDFVQWCVPSVSQATSQEIGSVTCTLSELTCLLHTRSKNIRPQMTCSVCDTSRDILYTTQIICGHACCKNCWMAMFTSGKFHCPGPTLTPGFVNIVSPKRQITAKAKAGICGFLVEDIVRQLGTQAHQTTLKVLKEKWHKLILPKNANVQVVKPQTCATCLTQNLVACHLWPMRQVTFGDELICEHGHWTCANCGLKGHAPLTCTETKEIQNLMNEHAEMLGLTILQSKNNDEKEEIDTEALSAKCVKLNSKKCPGPGCNIPLQRREGCLHMTCKMCEWEFCWSCLGAWPHKDDQGYFSCPVNAVDGIPENSTLSKVLDNLEDLHFWLNLPNRPAIKFDQIQKIEELLVVEWHLPLLFQQLQNIVVAVVVFDHQLGMGSNRRLFLMALKHLTLQFELLQVKLTHVDLLADCYKMITSVIIQEDMTYRQHTSRRHPHTISDGLRIGEMEETDIGLKARLDGFVLGPTISLSERAQRRLRSNAIEDSTQVILERYFRDTRQQLPRS